MSATQYQSPYQQQQQFKQTIMPTSYLTEAVAMSWQNIRPQITEDCVPQNQLEQFELQLTALVSRLVGFAEVANPQIAEQLTQLTNGGGLKQQKQQKQQR